MTTVNGHDMCEWIPDGSALIGSTCPACHHSFDLHWRRGGGPLIGFQVPYCLGCLMDALVDRDEEADHT